MLFKESFGKQGIFFFFLHQIRCLEFGALSFALFCPGSQTGKRADFWPHAILLLLLRVWILHSPRSRMCSVFMVTRNRSFLPHLPRSIRFRGWAFPVVWRSWVAGGEAVCEEEALHAGVCQEDLWVPQFRGCRPLPPLSRCIWKKLDHLCSRRLSFPQPWADLFALLALSLSHPAPPLWWKLRIGTRQSQTPTSGDGTPAGPPPTGENGGTCKVVRSPTSVPQQSALAPET